MNLCKITKTLLDIVGIVAVSIIILMYIPKPYSEILAIVWTLLYSYVTFKGIRDKGCNFEEFN